MLVQEFIEDVYARLDNIGQSVNKSLTPLIQYLESQDNDQVINQDNTPVNDIEK